MNNKSSLFDNFPSIQTSFLQLRAIQDSDFEDLWEIYSNPLHFQFTPNTSTQNKDTLRKRIDHFQRDFIKKRRLFLGVVYQEKLISVLEVFDYKKRSDSVTIGYRTNHDYWNQGLTSQALYLLCHFLVEECHIEIIKAFVMPENKASQRVLIKNGFQQVGESRENWKGQGEVNLLIFQRSRNSSSH